MLQAFLHTILRIWFWTILLPWNELAIQLNLLLAMNLTGKKQICMQFISFL